MQLAHAVDKLCRQKDPDGIQGLDMSNVEVILPVVIMRDDIGSAWGMNAYLNIRFQESKTVQAQGRAVTALFCLSANDIEMISSYLFDTRLLDILMARYRAERPLMASFWTTENTVLKKRNFRKPQFVFDQMKELTAMSLKVLGLKPSY